MRKPQFIISLVMLAVIIATLSHGIIAAAFSLFAFALLFYYVGSQPTVDSNDKAPYE